MTTALDHVSPEIRRFIREAALTGVAYPLFGADFKAFGPAVLPLTPRHHLLLLTYRNPCFCGGPATLPGLLQYLWLCSPAFRALEAAESAAWRRRLGWGYFAARWRRAVALGVDRFAGAVDLHAASFLLDRPAVPMEKRRALEQRDGAGPRDAAHELVSLESVCRRYLGYSRAEFWHTPYVTTNGLLGFHFRPSPDNPEVPSFDRERDRAAGARLRERIRRQREAQSLHRA